MRALRSAIFGMACGLGLILTSLAQADGNLDISNWKEILPDAMYAKLVDDAVKKLNTYCSNPSQFNQNGRRIQAEATNLAVYAEVARRAGQANAGGLRKTALELLEAAKTKKADEAKTLAASLAHYKSLASAGGGDWDFAKSTEMKIIMDVGLKEIDKNLTPYKRLTSTSLASRQEEIIQAMYKVAALSVSTTAHVPATDLPKGKTAKDWLSAAADMRKHALEAAAAAKAKKLSDLKTAVNNLTGSCAKCHDDFRKEEN